MDVVVLPPDANIKLKIAHAVDRPLKDMHIADICEACGISKTTFYAHFASKYEISFWHNNLSVQMHLNNIGRTLTWRQGLTKHLSFLATESVLHRYASYNELDMTVQNRVAAERMQTLEKTIEDKNPGKIDDEVRYQLRMFSSYEPYLYREWIMTEGNENLVEVYAEYIENMVPRRLHDLVELDKPM